tara:strand:- start:537 stop:800 length:264 start_codon:yes stop_codon:yes gene_type:complete
MKLTASRLKRLIREELSSMAPGPNMLPQDNEMINMMGSALEKAGMPLSPEELSAAAGVPVDQIETLVGDHPNIFRMDYDNNMIALQS